jgi:hypothetical protein
MSRMRELKGSDPMRRLTTAITDVSTSAPKVATWSIRSQSTYSGGEIQCGITQPHQITTRASTVKAESIAATRRSPAVMLVGQHRSTRAYAANGSDTSNGTTSTRRSNSPG